MTENNMKATLSGAFGGEIKYLILIIFACSGVLFGTMMGAYYVFGPEAGLMGLIVGGGLAFAVFIIAWPLIYVTFQQRNIPFQHLMIIIRLAHLKINNAGRLSNFVWNTHYTEKNPGHAEEELDKDGNPTGWRSKSFLLSEPTEFNPGYAEYGMVEEFVVQYYGEWSDQVIKQPGVIEYKDMAIPVGTMDIITVKPVEYQNLNIKHGARIPIFRLIGGGLEANYHNPEILIPNPNTGKITYLNGTIQSQVQFNAELRKRDQEIERLQDQARENKRQSQEDKKQAIHHESIHLLDYSEMEGLKEALGDLNNRVIAVVQRVVRHIGDWEETYKSLMGNKMETLLPWIILGAIGISALIFIAVSPDLTNQAMAAIQNPILDLTVAIIAIAAILAFLYLIKRRRKRRS